MPENLETRSQIRQILTEINGGIGSISNLLSKIQSIKSIRSIRSLKRLSAKSMANLTHQKHSLSIQQLKITSIGNIPCQISYNFRKINTLQSQISITNLDAELSQTNGRSIQKLGGLQTVGIQSPSKHNWIQKYLDYSNCKVRCLLPIKDASEAEQIIEATVLSKVNDIFVCQVNGKQVQIAQAQFYLTNKNVRVVFPEHRTGYRLNMGSQDKKPAFVYMFQIQKAQRIIIKISVPHHQQQIQRIGVFKVKENGKTQLVWGNYEHQSFEQVLDLSQGKYILTSLSNTASMSVDLYFSEDALQFYADSYHPSKSFNLLTSSFQECDHFQMKDRSQKTKLLSEFARVSYLDVGLIIEIFNNVYENQAQFVDLQPNSQDKELMFKEIYTKDQLEDRYMCGQSLVKFYSILQKPARLFIPKKNVIVGNRAMANIQVHSVFK